MATEPSRANLEAGSPLEQLEARARWQRAALHADLSDLKAEIAQVFDPNNIGRRYFWQIALGLAVGAARLGYGVAGIFARK